MQIIQEKERSKMGSHVRVYNRSNYPFHWHNKYELFQVLNNPCHFLVNGQLIHAQPGDLIAIDGQTVHRLIVDSDNTQVRIIQFPVHILLNSSVPIRPLKPHITRQEIAAHPQLEQTLAQLFPIMDQEPHVPISQSNPYLQSLFAAVYFLLMRYFATEELSTAASDERREFYNVVEWINRHCTQAINIQTTAAQLYVPRGRLARLFRKYSGMDMNEYINSQRINHANQLLMQGYRIAEAATESGFQSIRTFNNTYKEQMGCTPSEYVHSLRRS